ncbi:PAS domain S-box protein [Candidatus Woesearchaeota archaeon]|nr:PAS domain S-box protein [Candidatus Woesearchaeota archaeon]
MQDILGLIKKIASNLEVSILIDHDLNIIWFNKEVEKKGFKLTKIRGKSGHSIFKNYPELCDEFSVAEAFNRHKSINEKIKERNIDYIYLNLGREKYVLVISKKTKDEKQGIIEWKETEEALRESFGKYHALFTQAMDGIVLIDAKTGYISDCNPHFETLSGRKFSQLKKMRIWDLRPSDKIRAAKNKFLEVSKKGKGSSSYLEFEKPNKEIVPVEFVSRVIKLKNKKYIQSIVRDISERRKIETQLKESEEKYRKQFEGALDAIFIAEADTGILIDCNDVACKLVERTKSEIVGKHQRILHPNDEIEKKVSKTFKQHITEKEGQVLEAQVITKKGMRKNVVIKANVFTFKGKKLIQGIFHDISEQKKANLALKENREKYKFLVDSAEELILIISRTGKILFANNSVFEVTGYSSQEVIGKSIVSFLCRDSVKKVLSSIEKEFLGRIQPGFEVRIKAKSGEIKILLLADKTKYVKEDGKIKGLLINAIDITEKKRIEEKLKESEKRFLDIALSSGDFIWEVDKNGKYKFASGSVDEILGYTPNEIIGKTPFDFMPKEEAKRIARIFKEIISEKRPVIDLQNWNLTKRGVEVCLLTNGKPILDKQGNVMGYRGIDKDITEQKKAEEERQKLENKLKERISELEKFQRLSVGRELKMIELKKRIRELEKKSKKR